jgi:hypothetical protein
VRLQTFRYQRSWAARFVPHFVTGLLAAARGGASGFALGAAAAASFELDYGGRRQLLRSVAPAGEGTNAVGLVPARGERARTLVLVAHHDAAQTGISWRIVDLQSRLPRPNRDTMDSAGVVPKLGLWLSALGCLVGSRRMRAWGGAGLAVAAVLGLETARNPAVPGASDNATGVAAVLALAERFAAEPLAHTDVLVLLAGCEESGMGGMAEWLRTDGARLDRSTTLVLGLDTLGAGEPAAVGAEGPFRPERYREPDLAWADRGAARAGMGRPRRMHLGAWTDPILAVHAGLPTVSLVSVNGSAFTDYHLPTDTADRVDWSSVSACIQLADGVARAFDDEGPAPD